MITQKQVMLLLIWMFSIPSLLQAQIPEVIPPYNIKTATFVQSG